MGGDGDTCVKTAPTNIFFIVELNGASPLTAGLWGTDGVSVAVSSQNVSLRCRPRHCGDCTVCSGEGGFSAWDDDVFVSNMFGEWGGGWFA